MPKDKSLTNTPWFNPLYLENEDPGSAQRENWTAEHVESPRGWQSEGYVGGRDTL